MPQSATSRFRHQEVRSVPAGYRVRTVKAGTHEVRVAFPPGPRKTGFGVVVGVLHPKNENPCPVAMKNPAELLLMGANPGERRRNSSAYDSLSVKEKLAFGRLGLGKAQIQTDSDVAKARRMVEETRRLRNRLPNPGNQFVTDVAEGIGEDIAGQDIISSLRPKRKNSSAAAVRNLREGFSGELSDSYYVADEPHIPGGDYADCGEFIAVAVKPTPSGETAVVQEIAFPGKDLELVSDPNGRQLYIVGNGQELTPPDIRIFTSSVDERVCLGECRAISYGMAKFGAEVPASARGENARWDHEFGEEGGTCPNIYYDRKMKRLILDRASYRIDGAWIRN